jgi:hypothetical protein
VQAKFSLEAYAYYIAAERRPSKVDIFILRGLYERAIAEAARRRFEGEVGAEAALRAFWGGYCDVLVGVGLYARFLRLTATFADSGPMGFKQEVKVTR